MATATSGTIERRIMLEGAFNFRDLGGYLTVDGRMVRWRRVYRADALDQLTSADIVVLNNLGLRTVVDLRSHTEVRRAPHPFTEGLVRYRHTPLAIGFEPDPYGASPAPEQTAEQLYRTMLDMGGEAIRALFEELAEPAALPLVFHCTAGKDRTGVAAALVLRALGVPDDLVAADYALSQRHMAPIIARLRHAREAHGLPTPMSTAMIEARAELLGIALRHLDEAYGGTHAYLRHIGVDEATVARLREHMLTPALNARGPDRPL